jgi:hypothetical protein
MKYTKQYVLNIGYQSFLVPDELVPHIHHLLTLKSIDSTYVQGNHVYYTHENPAHVTVTRLNKFPISEEEVRAMRKAEADKAEAEDED